MKRPRRRKAKALARANRQTYVGLAIGAVLSVALLTIALRVVPLVSPSQMVKAQAVRAKATDSAIKPPPVPATPAVAATLHPARPPAGQTPSSTAHGPAAAPPARVSVGFDQLAAFPFEVTDQMLGGTTDAATAARKTLAQIPDRIKALNDKPVSVQGFMLPMNFQKGLTTDFLIMRNQSLCCYGVAPKITEWVNVRMIGKGVKPIMDVPVTACGTFHVGDVRERGDLVGIYQMDCDQLRAKP